MKEQKCRIEEKTYESGAMVCDEKLCYLCDAGTWEKKGALDLMGDAMEHL